MVPTDTDITVQCTQSLPYLISFFLVRSGQEKYYGRKNYYGPIKSFGPSPNTSMLIISCLCLTSACATDISSQRIQRINYRVVFEKVNDLYLGRNTGYTRSKFHCRRRSICMSCTATCLNVKLLAT